MVPYYERGGVVLYRGDCREVMPELEIKFDACITDPPYGLSSKEKRSPQRKSGVEQNKRGFMGMQWDGSVPDATTWERVLSVLKPGSHMLAFGGTRTHHRLMCAIEDAGFEIRDCLMYLFGSGFPKSLDIYKSISKTPGAEYKGHRCLSCKGEGITRGNCRCEACDGKGFIVAAKLWDGYGTALKPAYEPIVLAMRPCEGTFAENALRHGVAGLNINGSRIGTSKDVPSSSSGVTGIYQNGHKKLDERSGMDPDIGRWPANVLLDERAAAMLPDAPGQMADASTDPNSRRNQNVYGALKRGSQEASAERRYTGNGGTNFAALPGARRLDAGSAARFFYTAKADGNERGTGNNHPTVKPLDLMRWLCGLLCPPTGGVLIDPFAGSGSTLLAGRRFFQRVVGIEIEEKYCEIIAKRLSQDTLQFDGVNA